MAETIEIIKQSNDIVPNPFESLKVSWYWGFYRLVRKMCPGFPPLLRMGNHDITVGESDGKYS